LKPIRKRRWRRDGFTLAYRFLVQYKPEKVLALILPYCILGSIPQGPGVPVLEEPCLEYTGPKLDGYGLLNVHGQVNGVKLRSSINAHRAMVYAVDRQLPPRRVVHHVCLNPSCVRRSHLLVVTPTEHRALHRTLPRGKRYPRYTRTQRKEKGET
jgi:HNH endonuclease